MGRKKTRRSNGEGSVFKTNDGLWKGEYQIGTDPFTGAPKKKYFQGKTQREVLQKIKAVRMKESLGISLEDEKMRYSKWLETWFHEYHAGSVAPKTAADNYRLINDYIKPRLGKKRIGEISTHDVQMFINELSRNGKVRGKGGLSYNSIRLILNIVRTSLFQAVINRMVMFNPAVGVKLPRKEVLKPDEVKFLTIEEEQRFISYCKDLRYGFALHFCLKTGLRRGELLGLRWSDIDWDNQVIRVNQALSRIDKPEGGTILELGGLKTRSSYRIIPIPDYLVPMLEEHRIQQDTEKLKYGDQYEDNDLVFCSKIGKPVEISRLYKSIKEIGRRAGIDKVHPHLLRHTYATRLAEAGIHPKIIQMLLGHSSIQMQAIYTHATIQSLRNAVQEVSQKIENDPPVKEGQ